MNEFIFFLNNCLYKRSPKRNRKKTIVSKKKTQKKRTLCRKKIYNCKEMSRKIISDMLTEKECIMDEKEYLKGLKVGIKKKNINISVILKLSTLFIK